jgi:hypothetical protein
MTFQAISLAIALAGFAGAVTLSTLCATRY